MKLFVHLLRAANRARVTGFGWAWDEDHIWDGPICAVGHCCTDDFGSGGGNFIFQPPAPWGLCADEAKL